MIEVNVPFPDVEVNCPYCLSEVTIPGYEFNPIPVHLTHFAKCSAYCKDCDKEFIAVVGDL